MAKPLPRHERIRSHVEAHGFTRDEVAKKLRWSDQRAYRLWTGRTEFTVEDLEKLAALIGEKVDDLLAPIAKAG